MQEAGEDSRRFAGQGEETQDVEFWEVQKLLAKRTNKETGEREYHVRWVACHEGEGELDETLGDVVVQPSTTVASWESESWLDEEGYGGDVAAYEKRIRETGLKNQKRSLVLDHASQAKASREEAKKRAIAINEQAERKYSAARAAFNMWDRNAVWPKLENERRKIVDAKRLERRNARNKVVEKPKPPSSTGGSTEVGGVGPSCQDLLRGPPAPTANSLIHDANTLLLALEDSKRQSRKTQDREPSAQQELPRTATTTGDSFTTAMESAFLSGGHIDPSILKLLGGAQWDVPAAVERQKQRYPLPPQEKTTESAPTVAEKKDDDAESGVQNEKRDNHDANDREQHDPTKGEDVDSDTDETNFFLLAPTTFHESADVLLVICGYSESSTFFSACSVSRRWRHVTRRMRRARSLVRNFCVGLQKSLTSVGMIPVAIASAATPVAMIQRLQEQTTRDLADPRYKGQNGGELAPMYDLIHGEQKEVKAFTLKCTPDSRPGSYWSNYASYNVLPEAKADNWSTATLLDSMVPTTTNDDGLICISIGRLPTPTSKGSIDDADPKDAAPLIKCGGHRRTGVRYAKGFTDMAVPVIYVKVHDVGKSVATDCKMHLAFAAFTGWRSEVGRSLTLRTPEEVEKDQAQDLVLTGGTPDELMNDDVKKAVAEIRRERSAKSRVAKAARLAPLWRSLFFSLPSPSILWRSFSTSAVVQSSNKFKLLRTAPSFEGKTWPLLPHDEVVKILKDGVGAPWMLFVAQLTPEQKGVLSCLGITC